MAKRNLKIYNFQPGSSEWNKDLFDLNEILKNALLTKNDANIFFKQSFIEQNSTIMVQFESTSLFDIYKVEKLAELRPILLKVCLNKKSSSKVECDQISDDIVEFERKLQLSKVANLVTEFDGFEYYQTFANKFINENGLQVNVFKS